MIPTLDKESSLEERMETLKEFGMFKMDSYFKDPLLERLRKETMHLIKTRAGDYEFGRNLRGGSLKKMKVHSPIIHKVYSSSWMKVLNKAYVGHNKGYCKEIYATHDYLNDKGIGRNGYLHFDRKWAFKFFIYLTDTSKVNGAFSCVPGSHKLGKKLRITTRDQFKNYSKRRNRILVDYDDMPQYKHKVEPVEAPKGTVIVFDTDVFHMGGLVETGKERVVIRSHNRE